MLVSFYYCESFKPYIKEVKLIYCTPNTIGKQQDIPSQWSAAVISL